MDDIDSRDVPQPALNRRDFLRLVAALGLTWSGGAACVAERAAAAVASDQAACAGMRQPTVVGTLTDVESSEMWRLFSYIGDAWQNGAYCRIDSASMLRPVLNAKTRATPSYLTEYRIAIDVLRELRRRYGDQEALRRFFFDQPDLCVKQYTVAELLNLQVSQGGFRRFGYVNYAGFMGGPFDNPAHLPYRSWRDFHAS